MFILALVASGLILLAFAWFVVCLPQHHVVLKKYVTEHFIFNWIKKRLKYKRS
jgi:hypothetical protein